MRADAAALSGNQAMMDKTVCTPEDAVAGIRADDLGALPIQALMARNPAVDWAALDDVIYG
nr:putative beta-ketoadipyl CoA thiolase [Chromobacterium sp.]